MRLRVAAYAVIVDDGRILLPHWRRGDRFGWTMPGGGLEPGEDPAVAAIREVKEETGYDVELDELLGIDNIVVTGGRRVDTWADDDPDVAQGLRIIYRAHIVGGELRVETDGSTDDVAWHRLDDVDSLVRADVVDAAMRMAGLTVA